MVDTQTIETFLKQVNGSLQPDHKIILERFLVTSKEREKLESKIKIDEEDVRTLIGQYKNSVGARHEAGIQLYRIDLLKEDLKPYRDLERQSEEIIRLYASTQIQDAETHPASQLEYGHS